MSKQPTDLLDALSRLESQFYVVYPDAENATYNSKVNYKSSLQEPFQKWCNYKEGYSLDLNYEIFSNNGLKMGDRGVVIVDPFSGSGTTPLAAKNWGFHSVGYEVNPFSHLFSKVKTANYSSVEISALSQFIETLCSPPDWSSVSVSFPLPPLKMAPLVFSAGVLQGLAWVHDLIADIPYPKVKSLAFFAWLANLERLSAYRKAGNGLKKIRGRQKEFAAEAIQAISETLSIMHADISESQNSGPVPEVFLSSSRKMTELADGTVDGIIFSPPYANCFDYSEIYKLELWFGGFVKSSQEMKLLRQSSLTSHLNGIVDGSSASDDLEVFLEFLKEVQLWDKRIPKMLAGYFEDMGDVLAESFRALKENGFCSIVVGTSNYGGVVIPTDLLLAKIAQQSGFQVERIEVVRWVITSSQQYEKTLPFKRFIRESIVHLRKTT